MLVNLLLAGDLSLAKWWSEGSLMKMHLFSQGSWNTVFNKAGATRVGFWGNKALSGYNWDAKTKNVYIYIHIVFQPVAFRNMLELGMYIVWSIGIPVSGGISNSQPFATDDQPGARDVFVVRLETLRSEPHFKLFGLGTSHRGIPTNFRTVWLLQKFFRNLTRSNTWNSYLYNWWFEYITYSQINEY